MTLAPATTGDEIVVLEKVELLVEVVVQKSGRL